MSKATITTKRFVFRLCSIPLHSPPIIGLQFSIIVTKWKLYFIAVGATNVSPSLFAFNRDIRPKCEPLNPMSIPPSMAALSFASSDVYLECQWFERRSLVSFESFWAHAHIERWTCMMKCMNVDTGRLPLLYVGVYYICVCIQTVCHTCKYKHPKHTLGTLVFIPQVIAMIFCCTNSITFSSVFNVYMQSLGAFWAWSISVTVCVCVYSIGMIRAHTHIQISDHILWTPNWRTFPQTGLHCVHADSHFAQAMRKHYMENNGWIPATELLKWAHCS